MKMKMKWLVRIAAGVLILGALVVWPYPFYLDRSTWFVIDLISAGFFIWVSFLNFFKNSEGGKIV